MNFKAEVAQGKIEKAKDHIGELIKKSTALGKEDLMDFFMVAEKFINAELKKKDYIKQQSLYVKNKSVGSYSSQWD